MQAIWWTTLRSVVPAHQDKVGGAQQGKRGMMRSWEASPPYPFKAFTSSRLTVRRVAEHADHDGQAHRSFSRSHRHHEKREHMSPLIAECA